MRAISMIGAVVVLVVNILISYNHSLELFISGKFTGWMAHAGVIGIETTFIVGALYIIACRMKGISPGVPAYAAGIQGVLLVTWSNVSAGWSGLNEMLPVPVGVILGIQIPISLIIMESILSRAIIKRPSKIDDEIPEAERVEPEESQTSQVDFEESHKDDEEKKTPLEVAIDYYESNGELPTIARLEELADTSTWKARKALAELRPQFENKLKPAELETHTGNTLKNLKERSDEIVS